MNLKKLLLKVTPPFVKTYVPSATPKKRATPVIPRLQSTNFASKSYPKTASFWNDVSDPIVRSALGQLSRMWYVCEDKSLAPRRGGESGSRVVLSDEWVVYEVDSCMDGHTYEFRFNGIPLFQTGHWRGKITSCHDLRPIFEQELAELIVMAKSSTPGI